MKDLLPAGFTGQIVDGLADALVLRDAQNRARANADSAAEWMDYALRLERRVDFLSREVERIREEALKQAASAEAARKLEAIVSAEGSTCPYRFHHKIASSVERRLKLYNEYFKLACEKRGVAYTPLGMKST